jgi:hypothetical protein
MKTKINVTQDNIDSGTRASYRSCPVAQALHDATGQDWWVAAFSAGNSDRFVTNCKFLELPSCAVDFVESFDKGHSVEPFTFTLDLLKDWTRMTNNDQKGEDTCTK